MAYQKGSGTNKEVFPFYIFSLAVLTIIRPK